LQELRPFPGALRGLEIGIMVIMIIIGASRFWLCGIGVVDSVPYDSGVHCRTLSSQCRTTVYGTVVRHSAVYDRHSAVRQCTALSYGTGGQCTALSYGTVVRHTGFSTVHIVDGTIWFYVISRTHQKLARNGESDSALPDNV